MERTEAVYAVIAKQREEIAQFAKLTDAQMESMMASVSTEDLIAIAEGDMSPMAKVAFDLATQYGYKVVKPSTPSTGCACDADADGCIAWEDDIIAYVERQVPGADEIDPAVIKDVIADLASDFRRDIRDEVARIVEAS